MVLIIDKSKRQGDVISEMFHYMGILSYPVTPDLAFSEINMGYRAVLVTDPLSLADPVDYVSRLRKYSGSIPIFALGGEALAENTKRAFEKVFQSDIYSSTLVQEVIKYQDANSLSSLGKYMLAGLDLGCDLSSPRYLSHPIAFTKTETMILRYLTVTYPNYVSAEEIMAHSLKPGRSREVSVIRAHVSSINKKFKSVRGRYLIHSIPGNGYIIITPEQIEKNKDIINK